MLVLGIETSGFEGSIALSLDRTCLGERPLNHAGRRHAQSLVLEIDELLRAHGFAPQNVEMVAVSRGPGSFTGLRVGMVCAKTFAYATQCRFIAIDTFAAIAENVPGEISRVHVIEDAQRDDLFVGEYIRGQSGAWKAIDPIQIISVPDFLGRRAESDSVIGPGIKKIDAAGIFANTSARSASEGLSKIGHADPPNMPSNWLWDKSLSQPKASVIAELARRLTVSEGQTLATNDTDFWKAVPFYLRMSAAEEKRAIADSGEDQL